MSKVNRFDVITIFPEYLAPLKLSLIGKAESAGIIEIGIHDLRAQTSDVHGSVDDTPYGGGAGMVMSPEPWGKAIDEVAELVPNEIHELIVLTPAGEKLTQALAQLIAKEIEEARAREEARRGAEEERLAKLNAKKNGTSIKKDTKKTETNTFVQSPESLKLSNDFISNKSCLRVRLDFKRHFFMIQFTHQRKQVFGKQTFLIIKCQKCPNNDLGFSNINENTDLYPKQPKNYTFVSFNIGLERN